MLIVNFKTYSEARGEGAVALAKICNEVALESGISIAVAVQFSDVYRVSQAATNVQVLAQHVDPDLSGAFTGSVNIEAMREAGAKGTLLNHSEKQVGKEHFQKVIERTKEDFKIIFCASSVAVAQEYLQDHEVDFIALEPPELIGGDISVSTAHPELISKGAEVFPKKKFLVGAGIKDGKDVKKALELGAGGVLVASGIVKASNQKEALKDLISGFDI